MKIKKALIFVVFVSAALCALNFEPAIDKAIQTKRKMNSVIDESMLKIDSYLPEDVEKSAFNAKIHRFFLNNGTVDGAETDESEDRLPPLDISSFYFVDVAKRLYSEFTDDEINGFDVLYTENPEFEYVYKLFTDQGITAMSMYESTLEDSVNFDSARENSNQRNPGIKTLVGSVTLIALGLPAWLASTFSASIAGISGSALVPIVGWALCAAIIIALTIVIIINWDLICAKFNAIVSFFVDAAIDFAEEILNLFGEIRQQAYESTLSNSIADAKCQYGSGKWTDDQLKNALNEALYFGFARVTTKELSNKNSRLHVYLGKYEDGYVIKGATNSGVYFNMSTTRWTYYESTLNYTMWVLNAAFLNFVMALNCDFRLCSTPSLFYNKTTKMTLGDSYYAKELKHINIFGYNWYSDVPIVIADRW